MSRLAAKYVVEDDGIEYPESDGAPMGENTRQVKWIIMLFNGFQGLFRDRNDVFIAADLFWYPVKGYPKIVTAPDVMLAFGRPPGDRRSYQQWKEENIPFQVVFEITSPSNKPAEMKKKFAFYEQYGVEEYYIYDPDENSWEGWIRQRQKLVAIKKPKLFVSPRLGISFDFSDPKEMKVLDPDGKPFPTYLELMQRHNDEMERADLERNRAEQHKRTAESERVKATEERNRADALAAKLRELGIDPDQI